MEFSQDWSHATFQLNGKSREAERTTAKEQTKAGVERVMSEAEAGLKALFNAEQTYFLSHNSYADSLAEAGFAPEACPDDSRAPVPGAGWVAGCNVVYSITFNGPATRERHFIGHARVAVGPAKGKSLLVHSHDTAGIKAGEVHPD
jgi:hypothetical protein